MFVLFDMEVCDTRLEMEIFNKFLYNMTDLDYDELNVIDFVLLAYGNIWLITFFFFLFSLQVRWLFLDLSKRVNNERRDRCKQDVETSSSGAEADGTFKNPLNAFGGPKWYLKVTASNDKIKAQFLTKRG